MKLVTIMLVRNEADILPFTLAHHYANGVDHVLVADNGSIDGTLDILHRYEKEKRLTLEHEPSEIYPQAACMTRLFERARDQMKADAIICADADEFFVPAEGDLKQVFEIYRASIIHVPTVNLIRHGAHPDEAPLPTLHFVRIQRTDPDAAWIYRPHKGKVMLRPRGIKTIDMGNHDVRAGWFTRRAKAAAVAVVHVPIRSFAQFERKVQFGAQALAANPDYRPSIGSHWRRWLVLYREGRLREEYDRQIIADDPALQSLLAKGVVTEAPPPWTRIP